MEFGGTGGGNGINVRNAETDRLEQGEIEEVTRDVLAVCRQGDMLGIAVVRLSGRNICPSELYPVRHVLYKG